MLHLTLTVNDIKNFNLKLFQDCYTGYLAGINRNSMAIISSECTFNLLHQPDFSGGDNLQDVTIQE